MGETGVGAFARAARRVNFGPTPNNLPSRRPIELGVGELQDELRGRAVLLSAISAAVRPVEDVEDVEDLLAYPGFVTLNVPLGTRGMADLLSATLSIIGESGVGVRRRGGIRRVNFGPTPSSRPSRRLVPLGPGAVVGKLRRSPVIPAAIDSPILPNHTPRGPIAAFRPK